MLTLLINLSVKISADIKISEVDTGADTEILEAIKILAADTEISAAIKISGVDMEISEAIKISAVIRHSIRAIRAATSHSIRAIRISQRDTEAVKASVAAMANRRAGKHPLGLTGLNHTKESTATAQAHPQGTAERAAAMEVILTKAPNRQTYF